MKAFLGRGILILALCPAAAVLSCSQPVSPKSPATMSAEEAKQALYDRGIHFSTITYFQTVGNDDLDAVELFLVAGMDVDRQAEYGETALMRAASHPDPAMARLLMAKGANVNTTSEYDNTPLQIAAQQNNIELVKEFLALGAEVDATNSQGQTPLILASGRGAVASVEMLLAANARLDTRANDWDALRFASNNDHQEVVDLLREAAEEPSARLTKDSPSEASANVHEEPTRSSEQTVEPADGLMAGDPAEMERQLIDGWVDDLERNRD